MKQRQKQNNYLLTVLRWGWKWGSTNNLYPRVLKEHRIANATVLSFHCICQLGSGNLRLPKTRCNTFKGGGGRDFVRPAYVMLVVWCKGLKTNFYRKNNQEHGANG